MNPHSALSPPAFVVALCGVAISVLFIAISLVGSDGDPSGVARFGTLTSQQTDYAQARLGRAVFARESLGHDGKFFFIQANDPLLLSPTDHASALDRPTYRSQRMLYPLLAGSFAAFDPHAILWTLIVVNLIMFGAGTWAVAALAIDADISSWFGLAFAANMGLVYSLMMDGATITAFALGCLGVLALTRRQTTLAALAFTGAVLAREVMILFAIGVVVGVLVERKRQREDLPAASDGALRAVSVPWAIVVAPAGAAVLWAGYVRQRITFVEDLIENEEITLIPLSGALQAMSSGSAGLADVISIALLMTLAVAVPAIALRTANPLVWGAVPFSVLALFLTVAVWQYNYNISRALAPLLTATIFGLGIMLHRASENPDPAVVPPG